jgi:osmotically-inducible protein OsmY
MRTLRLPLLIALLLLASAAAPAGARSQPDDLITMRIQVGLYSAPEIDPESIAVVTKDGNVRLTGVVPSADVKQRVDQMVHQTEGVKSVDNALTVDASARLATPGAPPADQALQEAVIDKLRQADDLSDSEITVRAVKAGVVELAGYSQSLDDQLTALRLARSVPGVVLVQNDMRTPPGAAHDIDMLGGQMQGADVRNRRESQAVRGQAMETPALVPGAPTPPRTPQSPLGGTDVETHSH